MSRYLHLLGVQLKVSLGAAVRYRADFFLEGVMSLYWLGWNLLPLFILYGDRPAVAGWSFPAALLVIAWFVLLRAFLEGVINPSLVDCVERIRTGSFDYLLLKPADSQFLSSTARFSPWRIVDVAGGVTLAAIAVSKLEVAPTAGQLASGLVLLLAGAVTMYSLWISIVAFSIWVVRLDNLTYLLSAIFDTARWPVQVFRGAWRVVFTFVIPVALMTTYPAMAVLGRLDATTLFSCIGAAALLALASRLFWRFAIRHYTSASS